MCTTTVTPAGKTVEVDQEGFLENRSDWNEEIAKAMAQADDCELTPDHWEVIQFLREYYDRHGCAPSLYALTKAMREKLGLGKSHVDYRLELLPRFSLWQALCYAHLPNSGTINVSGRNIEVDEVGSLLHAADWTEEVAKTMAALDDFELTIEHWKAIRFLREYYEKYQIAPSFRMLLKEMGERLGPGKGRRDYLYTLFPGGPVWQACRYAGLPRPHEYVG